MLLNEVFEKEVSKKPDHLFSEFEGKKITYNEANITANNLANALISEGLKKGDRFSFLSKNCPEMAIMYYAASKVGLVPVPLNYRLADKEWEYIINDSGSKLIIARKSEYVTRINFRHNGNNRGAQARLDGGTAGAYVYGTIQVILSLAATDYVEVFGNTDNGSTDVYSDSTPFLSFAGHLIG